MKIKKISWFKAINIFMAVFCVSAMCVNYVGVNVYNSEKATSSIGNNIFEYQSKENKFSINRNNKLIGSIPTDKNLKFVGNNYLPSLNCNATVIGAAGAGAAAVGGAAVAAGTVGGAAVAAATATGWVGAVAGAAVVVASGPVGWFLGGVALG